MQTELIPTPCPECGALRSHHPLCSRLSEAEARVALKHYYDAFLRDSDAWRESRIRLKNAITLWQGKFRIVTHENNQLRKALYKSVKAAVKHHEPD